MSVKGRRFLLGVFKREDKLLHSAEALKNRNIPIYDIFTPFPVHGLDELLGIKRSRLPIVCFIAASIGLMVSLYFQYWTSAVDWPINVGGKPFNSFPAFVPVAFEITVLFGALFTVAAFLFRCKLFPGSDASLSHLRQTDDTFILVVEEADAGLDLNKVRSILIDNGADEVTSKMGDEWHQL